MLSRVCRWNVQAGTIGRKNMTTPSKHNDEFDAIRVVFETLKPFPKEEQQRLLRWVQEKLGLGAASSPAGQQLAGQHAPPPPQPSQMSANADIKTFIDAKHPKSDNQFAAAVAYFYKFEAPSDQRKDSINKDDLIDACRKAQRKRPATPAQVLINALHQGLLDKAERGQYRINSVGENLVAMVLPSQDRNPTNRPTTKVKKTLAKKQKRKGT